MTRSLRHRLWALLLLLATGAPASTVVPMGVDQLTDHAGRIFLGTCIAARGDTIAGAIVTRFDFVVTEGLKGVAAVDTLRVTLPGGVFGGLREEIAGMPAFVPGDEAVLFLTDVDRRGRAWPVGLAQGDFRVLRRPGSTPLVRQDTRHLRFAGAAARPAAPSPSTLPLAALLDRVRARLGEETDAAGSAR